MSILLLEPNSNSSISESSESKSENFFFSFELDCLWDIAAIAAVLSGKPVTGAGGGTAIGEEITWAIGGEDNVAVLVELGKAKRSSFSFVEAASVERGFLVGGVRVLTDNLARSLNKIMFL